MGPFGRFGGGDSGCPLGKRFVQPQVVPPLHGDEVAKPHVSEFVQNRHDASLANRVGHFGPEHVHLGEGHAAGVLHGSRIEFGHKELVVFRKGVRNAKLPLEVLESLFRDVENVVRIKVFGERLPDIEAEGDRAPVARRQRIMNRNIGPRNNCGDVGGDPRGLRKHPGLCAGRIDWLWRGGVGHDNPIGGCRHGEVEGCLEVGLFKNGEYASRIGNLEL